MAALAALFRAGIDLSYFQAFFNTLQIGNNGASS